MRAKRTELPVDLAEVIVRLLFDGNPHVRVEFVGGGGGVGRSSFPQSVIVTGPASDEYDPSANFAITQDFRLPGFEAPGLGGGK